MDFVLIENKAKKILAKFPKTRRFFKGIYHRVSYSISKDKIKYEGNLIRISPEDEYEYFFGYYDKSPWDITDRYMISLRVKNAHKVPDSTEEAQIVVFDTQNNNKMEIIGTTHCWNTQQGCMAQWLAPDYKDRIIYNDFRENKYVSVVYNFKTKKEEKTYDMPIYDVVKNGKFALTLDFSRLHRLRKGYGYANIKETTRKELCPDSACIWKIDLENGKITPVIKYTDLSKFEPRDEMIGAEHKVNHIMISPNGKRFMVLHRWFKHNEKFTRLVTMSIDGSDKYNLSDDNFVSHCCWKNDKEILSFLRKKGTGDHYYLMKDKTKEYEMQWPELSTDGHCTYSPDGKYVITDTYPNRKRMASVYLCKENEQSNKIASVFAPFKYDNDVRCDLHPRWSNSGDKICIDSVHEGKKEIYAICAEKDSNAIKFTAIMPLYNAENSIKKSIESVVGQTYDNWELIIVDDGSTDSSYDICKKYAQIDNRIKIYKKDNEGPGKARNYGINKCTGDYICFIDSDDYLETDYFRILSRYIKEKKCDLVYFNIIMENDNGKITKINQTNKFEQLDKEDVLKSQIMGILPWAAWVKVAKADIIKKYKFSSLNVGEEAIFSFYVLYNAKTIGFIDKNLYHYVHNESGQHTKGGIDPWKNVAIEFKKELSQHSEFKSYKNAVNGLALRGLSIAIKRVCCENNYKTAKNKIRQLIKHYSKNFDIYKSEIKLLDSTSKIILTLIRLKTYRIIYVATKLKYKGR